MTFGGLTAVRDLSFSVEQGEVFAIIGPNGAGKTSVFNVITRVFSPSAGRVPSHGRDITALPRHRIADAGIARTFQNIELFESATVIDNLLLGRHRFAHGNVLAQVLRLPSVRRAEDNSRARVEDIIELLDLSPYRNVRLPACLTACARSSSLRARWRPSRNCCCSMSPRPASIRRKRATWRSGSTTSRTTSASRSSWSSTTCRWSPEVADRVLVHEHGRGAGTGAPDEVRSASRCRCGLSGGVMLSVRNIETWYGPVNAIKGVSIDVAPGRIVAVLGANGAGKTTLLKTIAGVVDPFKGSVTFDGSAINGLDPGRGRAPRRSAGAGGPADLSVPERARKPADGHVRAR